MNVTDFQQDYTGSWISADDTTKLLLTPTGTSTGSVKTWHINVPDVSADYTLRQAGKRLYIQWHNKEFLVRPSDKGFNLLIGETTVHYFERKAKTV